MQATRVLVLKEVMIEIFIFCRHRITKRLTTTDARKNKIDEHIVNTSSSLHCLKPRIQRRLLSIFHIGCAQQESSWVKHGLNSGKERRNIFYFFQLSRANEIERAE